MTASDIIQVLAEKHREDVFIPECKTGESAQGYTRLDAWAMKKSWTHPLTIGYEVKVNRQDFLRDEKWVSYLPYCDQLYFVCPKELIQPDELPPEVGLMWLQKTRLYTKKKAINRHVVVPEDMYRYILMSRVQVTRERPADRLQAAKDYLEQKEDRRYTGMKLGSLLAVELEKTKQDQVRLEEANKALQSIQDLLEEYGLKPPYYKYQIERIHHEIKKNLSADLAGEANLILAQVEHAKRLLRNFEDTIRSIPERS